jgi:hypothetical protein
MSAASRLRIAYRCFIAGPDSHPDLIDRREPPFSATDPYKPSFRCLDIGQRAIVVGDHLERAGHHAIVVAMGPPIQVVCMEPSLKAFARMTLETWKKHIAGPGHTSVIADEGGTYQDGPDEIAAAAALAHVDHQRVGALTSEEQWAFFCKTGMALKALAGI